MTPPQKGTPLTGKRVAMIFVGGFGIVIAVNITMATLAVSGFSGVVVPNSYVASQEFNGWLKEAERSEALGWDADATRSSDGRLKVATTGVPAGAVMSAELRRPLGQPEMRMVTFKPLPSGQFISDAPVPSGRWIMRLSISVDGENWSAEKQLQ